jgi:hypothetical protein
VLGLLHRKYLQRTNSFGVRSLLVEGESRNKSFDFFCALFGGLQRFDEDKRKSGNQIE